MPLEPLFRYSVSLSVPLVRIISELQCFVVNKGVVSFIGLVGEFRNSRLLLTLESEVLSVLLSDSFVL